MEIFDYILLTEQRKWSSMFKEWKLDYACLEYTNEEVDKYLLNKGLLKDVKKHNLVGVSETLDALSYIGFEIKSVVAINAPSKDDNLKTFQFHLQRKVN